MRLLADTHAAVWFGENNPKLSAAALAAMSDPTNEVLFSPASYWEIAIKVALGKWTLTEPYPIFIDALLSRCGFQILPILPPHAARLLTLPSPANHRDPFDRMLVAQTLVEGIRIVSADPKLDQYGVTRIW